jgi:hypothetical protein
MSNMASIESLERQPCVVGSKHGLLVKDYKVTRKAEPREARHEI